jgi:hypothetical protein
MRSVRQNYLVLASIYAACMAWVWAGVILESEHSRYDLLCIHVAAFLTLVAIISLAGRGIKPLTWRFPQAEWLASLLLIASVGFILIHWAQLGGMPAVSALKSTDDMEIAKLRQSVTEHGALFNYGSIFLIRVMLPLLVLRYVLKKQYWSALLVGLFGAVYGLSLMQKSYPIFIVAPAIVYFAFTGRRAAAFCGIGVFLCVVTLVLITNARLRPGQFSDIPSAFNAGTIVVTSLTERVLVVPGRVVSDWLNAFPTIFPYEYGCGYRFVSAVLRCDFINNSVLTYRHYFPENVSQGLVGTYNAAHFAEEYANFGPLGLIVAATLASVVLFAAAWITSGRDTATIVAVNFPFIASLSSSALQTTMVSGGWFAMVGLSLILLPGSEATRVHPKSLPAGRTPKP